MNNISQDSYLTGLSNGYAYLLAALAGVAGTLSLAPYDWVLLAPLSALILFLLIVRATKSKLYFCALAYGLGLFGSGVSWVYNSVFEYGIPVEVIAGIITAGLCVLMAFLWALPWVLWRWIQPSINQPIGIVTILSFAALWVLGEWSRSWLLTGFPWLYLGYAATDTPLSSWAPLLGVYGVSFMVIVLSGAVWLLFQKHIFQRHVFEKHVFEKQSLQAIFLIIGTAIATLMPIATEKHGDEISVALVQPNISQHLKWQPSERTAIIENLMSLSERHWDKDMIVWPEAALPMVLTNYNSQVTQLIDHLQQRARASETLLITGIPTTNDDASQYFNSVIALGEERSIYNKQHLVPFGEYVPFKQQIGGLLTVIDVALPNMGTGSTNQSGLLMANGIRIAPAICYEIAFPQLVSSMVADSNLLLTVSNDTWFGRSIGPHQHMQMARMRVLENAKPLLRATNNGITSVVDFDGTQLQTLPQFQADVLSVQIQPRKGQTLYNRWGNWPILFVCLVLLLLANRQRQ